MASHFLPEVMMNSCALIVIERQTHVDAKYAMKDLNPEQKGICLFLGTISYNRL